jgi:hypothetical protein
MEYSHSLLRPFYTKLVWVLGFPRTRERGASCGFRVLGDSEPAWLSVPRNPEPILMLCKKALKAYANIPFCVRNAYKWIVKWVPSSQERNHREPGTLTPLLFSLYHHPTKVDYVGIKEEKNSC